MTPPTDTTDRWPMTLDQALADGLFSEEEETDNEEALYEHFRFTADPNQSLLRIDKFLTDRAATASSWPPKPDG